MALISCKLLDEETDVADRQYTYKATFEAKSDIRDAASRDILDQAVSATPDPIPVYGASYALLGATDPNAFAKKYKAKRRSVDETGSLFRIDVEWFAADGDPDDDATSDTDPATRAVLIDGDEEEVEEICEEGWNEEELPGIERDADTFGAIENAAGKEPGTPMTKSRRLPVLIFRKNFVDEVGSSALSQIMSLAATHTDTLNNATFCGASAGKAIVRSIKPSEYMFAGEKKYRVATIRIAFNQKGWSYPMVNRGYEHFQGVIGESSWKLVMARNPDENKKMQLVSEPVNLQLNGTRVADGGTGTVINWRTSAKTDFTALGVGTTF